MKVSSYVAALYSMLALVVLMAVRCAWVWSQLPPMMAAHFNAYGVPDGFQSRATFMSIMASVMALMIAVFGVLPRLLHKLPARVINLPYREYWMTPERKHQALDRYAAWSAWFGVATCALLVGVFELTLRANIERQPLNPLAMWVLIGGYLLGTLIAMLRLATVFKPPQS